MKNVSFFLFATLGTMSEKQSCVVRVFRPNNLLIFIALSFFALQSVAYSQESGFVTFKDLDYSISYPQTWVRDNDVPNQFTRLYVFKDVDSLDYIALIVIEAKFSGKIETNDEFVKRILKNPETYTNTFINPRIIKNERITWADHDAVRLQVEYTVQSGDKLTALFYLTMVDDTAYQTLFQCRTVYFPQFKPIMEKVAASFSLSPIKKKADKPVEKKVVVERKPKSKLRQKGKN